MTSPTSTPTPVVTAPCVAFNADVRGLSIPCSSCTRSQACRTHPSCTLEVPITISTKDKPSDTAISCETAAKRTTINGKQIWESGQIWIPFTTGTPIRVNNNVVSNAFCVLKTPSTVNELDCCLGRISDPQKCNGLWCPKSCANDQKVIEYCSTGNNITSKECAYYCPSGTTQGRAFWCDAAAVGYCKSTEVQLLGVTGTSGSPSDDPFCTCINSSIPRPACFDSECTATGYQTVAQLKETDDCGQVCQQIVNCVQDGSCNVSQDTFSINCPGYQYPNKGGNGGTTPQTSETLYEFLAIIVAVLIVIILLGLVILGFTGRR